MKHSWMWRWIIAFWIATPPLTPAVLADSATGSSSGEPWLSFNQDMIEGWAETHLNLDDPVAVFAEVFARLPHEVIVYPSENYYYWQLYANGRQIWGNIRLPAGQRERGILAFSYSDFNEFPTPPATGGVAHTEYFDSSFGIQITERDPLIFGVAYGDREVVFRLHPLHQEPPDSLTLGENEEFVQRTVDESGFRFLLLFSNKGNFFFWVLNEESPPPDEFLSLDEDIIVGRRSGFAFWIDRAHQNRKVLASVRQISVLRNDYYDGPFDQLADNYAEQTGIAEYMQRAFPDLKGRINQYGYYTDSTKPKRVALNTYGSYYVHPEIMLLIKRARRSSNPLHFISRAAYLGKSAK